MATQFSMLSIFNAALLEQGCQEVSENDGTDEFRVLAAQWPFIIESELEDGNYHFTREQGSSVTRIDGKYGFDDGYMVPAESVFVRHVWILNSAGERCEVDWTQDATYVYLNNEDGVYFEYITVSGESLWSANFSAGVKKRLEAVISRSLKEEFSEANALDQMAETHFQRARTHSSKSRLERPMYRKGPIALARNRRGPY